MSTLAKCKLQTDGSVCLQDILNSFNSAIKEEHAWALCYQCSKYYLEVVVANRDDCYVPSEVYHIFLQTDGNVHSNTLFGCGDKIANRRRLTDEQELICGLGFAVYNALDYGTNHGEERAIGPDLEQLISDMISEDRSIHGEPHHETDDEGIEKDAEEGDYTRGQTVHTSLQQVVQRCEKHLNTLSKNQVVSHYKAVVRALVTEALELSTFLEKVSQGTSSLLLTTDSANNSELDHLQFADWARFWVQVIGELRMGVKLRKVHYSRAPIEYELTPYEILMKDIRSCRYNLRKVMVDCDVPYRVTKDAHAIILEFIRSRPPLKKVSDRKLPPPKLTLSLHDQLMNSIRKGRPLKSIKTFNVNIESTPMQTSQPSTRKLIKVDFSQLDDVDDDDDDVGHTDNSSESDAPGLWPHEEYRQLCDVRLEAYDLATLRPNFHTYTLGVGSQSVPQSRPGSRQSCNSSETDSLAPDVAQSLQDQLINGKSWSDGMSLEDRLSLTLEEIVHIRSVLTKAELEGLPVEGHVKADVETRKVCFLCLKTRFGIFGPWGQKCTLCKKTVCARCYCRMNIPMEYFSGVPVVLLSPSILGTPEEEKHNLGIGVIQNSECSSYQSPRAGSSHDIAATSAIYRFKSKAATVGRAAAVVDKLKGSQMVVCHDCRMMVLQIIKSARTNRTAIRNRTLQNLSLNLSTVF